MYPYTRIGRVQDVAAESKDIRDVNMGKGPPCITNHAVSYTHLDVYKRQTQDKLPATRSMLGYQSW